MELIELIDLVLPCKPGRETKDEPSQPSRPNGTRRRETCNPSVSSLDVSVSGDSDIGFIDGNSTRKLQTNEKRQ